MSKQPISSYSTAEMAFATGHKITCISKALIRGINTYVARLDGGPLEPITKIRYRLESQLLELERKQGKRGSGDYLGSVSFK